MSRRAPARALLARRRLPDDLLGAVYRREDWPGWPPDASIITVTRRGEAIDTFAFWEPLAPPVLQPGQVGDILIYPFVPEDWAHLQPGQTVNWAHLPLSAQILEPLEVPA